MRDRVFAALARSPIGSRDMLELASRPIHCRPLYLTHPYRLRKLEPPNYDWHCRDSVDRTRGFMLSHGVVTFGLGSQYNTATLAVPNLAAQHQLCRNVDQLFQLSSCVDIGSVFESPSCSRLRAFLQSIVDRTPPLHADKLHAIDLTVELDSFVRALIVRTPRYRVVLEAAAEKRPVDHVLLVDMHSNVAVVLAVKRLQPTGALSSDNIDALTDEQVRCLIIDLCKSQTVGDVLEKKRAQARRHAASMSVTISGQPLLITRVHAFAVVLVGRRLLIESCQETPADQ